MRKYLFLLFILLFCFTCYEVVTSLALLETNQSLVSEAAVGKWNITVNGANAQEDIHFDVTSVNVVSDPNVLEGYMAPSSTAYFNILLVPNDTDVSFRYDISIDWNNISNDEITLLGITEENGHDIIQTGKGVYSGKLSYSEILNGDTLNLRVDVKWNNNEDNNYTDSEYGVYPGKQISIPLSVHLIQYNGEDIPVYTG